MSVKKIIGDFYNEKENLPSLLLSMVAITLFIVISLVLVGCGGGGGVDSYSEQTGLLTMDVSKGSISVNMSDETSSTSDENVDVSFQYSAYKDSLKALPVVIKGYHIDYAREDCSNCPTPPSTYVSSGLRIEAGESKTQSITVFSGRNKLSLPVSAIRNDIYNPVLNQNPIVPDSHNQKIATGTMATAGAIGDGASLTYDFGSYAGGTNFQATLLSPVKKGSVNILVNDSVIGGDNGTGTITAIKNGNVSSEKIAVGDGSTVTFYASLSGGIKPTSFSVTAGSVTGYDNGSGTIVGTGISGSIEYQTGYLTVSFFTAPASGTNITVSYSYTNSITGSIDYSTGNLNMWSDSNLKPGDKVTIKYTVDRTTGTISGNTITFPTLTLSSDTSTVIVKGTVLVMLDGNIVGRDNGSGKVLGNGVNGNINYQNRTVDISMTPVPASGVVTVSASLSPASIILTPVPIVKNSLSIKWGDITCGEVNGTLQYPCSGSVNYSSGAISNFAISNSAVQAGSVNDISASFNVNSFNTQGGENVGYGTGASEYTFSLKYIPVAPPSASYALTIMTTGGLIVKDSGGGVLTGDVCSTKQSTINYATGNVSICFSRPVRTDEAIFAYYRTSSVRLKATVRAVGNEVGGNSIELKRDISLIFN